MGVNVYVYIDRFVLVCVCVYSSLHMHVHIYLFMYVCIYIYVHAFIWCTHRLCVHMYVYIYIYIYIYMYVYTHTHTHTNIHLFTSLWFYVCNYFLLVPMTFQLHAPSNVQLGSLGWNKEKFVENADKCTADTWLSCLYLWPTTLCADPMPFAFQYCHHHTHSFPSLLHLPTS